MKTAKSNFMIRTRSNEQRSESTDEINFRSGLVLVVRFEELRSIRVADEDERDEQPLVRVAASSSRAEFVEHARVGLHQAHQEFGFE